ncbi:cytochrome c [Bradyrhizobium diazoefficiens]
MLSRYVGLAVAIVAVASLATRAFAQETERKGISAPPGHVFKTIVSGYQFRSKETRALQDDDLENPGFLAVERAADVWKRAEGSEGKSCMSCHGEAETSMKGVGAAIPKWDDKRKRPVNLEQRINICRTEHMKAEPWKFKSQELTDMTTFVRYQSHGMPVAVKTDGPMSPWFERGKQIYYTRYRPARFGLRVVPRAQQRKIHARRFSQPGPDQRLSDLSVARPAPGAAA